MKQVGRRRFIYTATALTASGSLLSGNSFARAKGPTIYVVHGKDVDKMVRAGIEKMGGWKAFVKPGTKVTIKPNAAWARYPEQGANTSPALVGACVKACKGEGANEVVVPENTCSSTGKAFALSGVERAVNEAGGRMYSASKREHFRNVTLTGAKTLKEVAIATDVLDTNCLINLPVAKDHSASKLTLSMKNWMGSVKSRAPFHLKGLDQCIADLNTAIKADLIIVDATRIMTTNGPRGPGKLEYPHQLIFGTDPVAVDAYASTLFKKTPFDIPHIKIAHNMKLGTADLNEINIVHAETD
jgi:uncharacterized protein (DUF362 family)